MTEDLRPPFRQQFDNARDPYTARNALGITTTGGGGFITAVTAPLHVTGTTLSIDLSAYATLASPTFTGTPAAPTAAPGTNTTQLATTAFVDAAITAAAATEFTASSTVPVAPNQGDHWYDLSTGVLSIYVNDGSSSQWVMVSPSGGGGGGGPPQGRLTLQTATPVMTTTQSAKTTIYYTPYCGSLLPIYDGITLTMTTFTELSVVTTDTTKSPAAIGASKVNDWFVWSDAGTLRIGHGPDWTSDTVRSAGTALTMVSGVLLNNASITNGPASQCGTYVGTTRSNASSQLDWILGGAASGGSAGFLGLWNCYNRVIVVANVTDNGATYTYGTATVRQARASAGNQISFVLGLQEDGVEASFSSAANTNATAAASAYWGTGLDSITVFGSIASRVVAATAVLTTAALTNYYAYPAPSIGFHYIAALETSSAHVNVFNAATQQVLSIVLRM